jgi:hypothetical protein
MTEEIQKGEDTTIETQPKAEVEKQKADESETEEVKTEEVKEEESGEEEETLKPQREARFVPYDKFKAKNEEVKTLKLEIERLSKRPDSVGTDDAIKKLSEKYPEVGKEFIEDLVSAAREGSKLPSDVVEKLNKVEAHELRITQDAGFDKEYSKLIKEVPEANDPKIKAKLKTLAFTKEFANAPLKSVYFGNPDEFEAIKPKKSAEQGKGGKADLGETTPSEIDALPEEERAKAIKAMTPTQYGAYKEHMRKNSEGFKTLK